MPEELPEISKRTSFSLNIVRIFAMIGVVNLHTILVFVQRPDMFHSQLWLPLETFLTFSMPAVSLFFILSGYLTINKKRDIRENLQKTCWRIFFPLFIFILLNATVDWFGLYQGRQPLLYTMYQSFLKVMGSDLWFMVVLGGFYLFQPLWYLLAEKKAVFQYSILTLGIGSIVLHFFNNLAGSNISHASLTMVSSYLALFLFGGYVRQKEVKISLRSLLLLSIAFVLLKVLTDYCSIQVSYFANETASYLRTLNALLGTIVSATWHLFMGVILWELLMRIPWLKAVQNFKNSAKIVERIGKIAQLSLGVYLIHPLLISLRSWVFGFEYDFSGLNVYQYIFVSWTSIFLLSLGLSLLISKIPGLKRIIGISGK